MKKTFTFAVALLYIIGIVTAQELLPRLQALPEVTDITSLQSQDFKEKYEIFVTQKVDYSPSHTNAVFKQRVFVAHVGFDRPTLLVTEGYGAEYAKNSRYREELSRLFNMNIVVVEHRYFLQSIPSPLNWDYLTVANSMHDLHNIRTLLGTIYKSKWVSTGVSKGGQTTIFYRTFYPNDVDVSVPYVAPFNKSREDGRHEKFISDKVGSAEERAQILAFQMEIMKRKATLMPMFKALVAEKRYVYRAPVEEIYDYCVFEYSFGLWQYGTPRTSIPPITADDKTLFDHWIDITDPMYFSYITQYSAFDVQAAREEGYYGYDIKPFKKYLSLKTTKDYLRRLMVPDGQQNIKWDNTLYKKTRKYLLENDPTMIFIYGSIDPWTASGITDEEYFKGKNNMLCIVDEGNSHRAKIGNISEANRQAVITRLSQWLGEQPVNPN